jgi:hypothetical protein
MFKSILVSMLLVSAVSAESASCKVIVDTGAGEPYFKVNGKRATPEQAFQAAGSGDTVEKCTAQKGNLETADGRPALAAFKCREVVLHITTKGNPSWKAK